jgi:hypothetical protein
MEIEANLISTTVSLTFDPLWHRVIGNVNQSFSDEHLKMFLLRSQLRIEVNVVVLFFSQKPGGFLR